jgi:excinuclease ABC subunit C
MMLPTTSEGFKLLTRIQDEVHRFAVEYHRKLREGKQTRSLLDDVPGIGNVRRKALLKHFGDIYKIKEASVEALAQAPSMDKRAAESVYQFFRS